MGKLEIVIGPMYAGKTTRLIEIYNRYKICNISTIVVNHSSDKRYGLSDLHSHQKVKIPCIECSDKLSKLYETHSATVKDAKVILINEAQFFTDLHEWVKNIVETKDVDVYLFGLDADYERKEFGQIVSLIPLCDSVTKLNAMCLDCKNGTPAIFTFRTAPAVSQKFIGGKESYKALCRKCYNGQKSQEAPAKQVPVSDKEYVPYVDVEDMVVYNSIRV